MAAAAPGLPPRVLPGSRRLQRVPPVPVPPPATPVPGFVPAAPALAATRAGRCQRAGPVAAGVLPVPCLPPGSGLIHRGERGCPQRGQRADPGAAGSRRAVSTSSAGRPWLGERAVIQRGVGGRPGGFFFCFCRVCARVRASRAPDSSAHMPHEFFCVRTGGPQ